MYYESGTITKKKCEALKLVNHRFELNVKHKKMRFNLLLMQTCKNVKHGSA